MHDFACPFLIFVVGIFRVHTNGLSTQTLANDSERTVSVQHIISQEASSLEAVNNALERLENKL